MTDFTDAYLSSQNNLTYEDPIFNTPFKMLPHITAAIWRCDEFNDTPSQYWQAHKKTAF